ncbi:hypothetical protein ACRDNQ_14380 [Palleronia sp. KMU-117]|uniref:hypothetical protein n=1 Tax=Palleronia sp. KMU-117 TaxID=3434108 RepID=UPI003D73A2B3
MRIATLVLWTLSGVALAGCNRGPDIMSLVQSPAEFACRAAVAEASGSGGLTTLAVAPTEAGVRVQIRDDRDGSFWTCMATEGGALISVTRSAMGRAAG